MRPKNYDMMMKGRMDGMELRRLALTDLGLVVNIYKDAVNNMIAHNIFQWDEMYPDENTLREDVARGRMFAGVENNEIASVFVLDKECDGAYSTAQWECGSGGFIVLHRFCVRVDFQHRGVGTKTMKLIEKKMKGEGITSIRLDTFSKNPYSLRMFDKLGYKRVGEAHWERGLFYIFEKII
jgi:ribosomal protein S18 acetylase RimI-like enzyme